MENLKKEQRYLVSPYYEPEKVDVMVDRDGEVQFYYNGFDEVWCKVYKYDRLFITEADAVNYARSFEAFDKKKVKDWLEHYMYDDEKLLEVMPERMHKDYKGGRTCYTMAYGDKDKMLAAISGNFCINGVSFKASEVSHIKHMERRNGEGAKFFKRVILKDGTKVDTETKLERDIIAAAFGENESGKVFVV